MQKLKVFFILLLLVVTGSAESMTSGLKPGEKAPAHNPQHITGPDAGSTVCPVWKYALAPACQVFLKDANENDVNSLLSSLSAATKTHKEQGFRAFVYFLNGNERQLKKLNDALKLDNVALCLIPKSAKKETLKMYKINRKAKSTVIVYKMRNVDSVIVNYDETEHSKALKAAISKVCK